MAEILTSLGVKPATPQFEVWNKLDLVDATAHEALTTSAQNRPTIFPVSAVTGEGVAALLDAISLVFEHQKSETTLEISFAVGKAYAWLHAEGVVLAERQSDEGWSIDVLWTERQAAKFASL